MAAQQQVQQVYRPRAFAAEQVNLTAEFFLGESVQHLRILARLLLNDGKNLIETCAARRFQSGVPRGWIECPGLDEWNQIRSHDTEVAEQFDSAPLSGRRPVVELAAIHFRGHATGDANLLLD